MAKPPARAPARKGAKSPIFNRPVRDHAPAPLEDDREPLPNFDLLNETEKEELLKKAAAKVEAREKDRAMEAFVKAEIERIERELHPEAYEEEKEITLDLAIFADRLIINGKHYIHGRTYKVKKGLYDAMRDMVARTHQHYAETHKDPTEAMYRSLRAITKDGPSYATITPQGVTRF